MLRVFIELQYGPEVRTEGEAHDHAYTVHAAVSARARENQRGLVNAPRTRKKSPSSRNRTTQEGKTTIKQSQVKKSITHFPICLFGSDRSIGLIIPPALHTERHNHINRQRERSAALAASSEACVARRASHQPHEVTFAIP